MQSEAIINQLDLVNTSMFLHNGSDEEDVNVQRFTAKRRQPTDKTMRYEWRRKIKPKLLLHIEESTTEIMDQDQLLNKKVITFLTFGTYAHN